MKNLERENIEASRRDTRFVPFYALLPMDLSLMNELAPANTVPDSPKKRRRQPAEVKDRILVAALETFADHGFAGASTREVAKLADVSLSLLLYHFQSKEQLWRAVVEYVREKIVFSDHNGERVADITATERLKLLVRQSVTVFSAMPALHRLMTLEAHQLTDRLSWILDQFIRSEFEATCALIEAAQKEGTVRNENSARLRFAMVAMAAIPFAVSAEYRELTGLNPFSSEEIEKTVDLINHLIFI